MSDPDPAYEKKILLDVVEQMKDPLATQQKQANLRRTIQGVSLAGLTAAFFLGINNLVQPFVIALVAAIAGCGIGFGLFLNLAQKQWPITSRHIDMESVRKRLQELGD